MNRFYSIIILLLILINIKTSFANNNENKEFWYRLYKKRVENICKKYKPKKIVFQTEEYKDYSKKDNIINKEWKEENITWNAIWGNNDLTDAIYTYKKNMNNIYKCWIIWVQLRSLNLIKKDLIQSNPNIKSKIEKTIKKVQLTQQKLSCKNNNNEKDSLQKLRILKQSTYELCKYHSYLEYIKERNKTIINTIPPNTKVFNISEIANLVTKKESDINKEISKSYKIFPIAFGSYTQYENNFSIHILLALLKDDFITFRQKLHDTINPINQVVYKISNAMKK